MSALNIDWCTDVLCALQLYYFNPPLLQLFEEILSRILVEAQKKEKKNHSFILSRALGHLPATRLLLLLKASKKQFDKSGFSEKIYRVSYFHSNELLPRNDKTMHSCYRSVSKFSEPQSIQMKQ